MSGEITDHLDSMRKGKVSIAEALKELDLAKSAFSRLELLENRQARQDLEIQKMSAHMSNLLQSHVFHQKIDDVVTSVDRTTNKKLDDILKAIRNEMQSKVSHETLEDILKTKVNYRNFNLLIQDFNILKSRLDRHILSEFEGLRTKMKIEISQRTKEAEDLLKSVINSEDFLSIKSRLGNLETEVNEILAEQNQLLEENEDYDSDEEMDNMDEDEFAMGMVSDSREDLDQLDNPINNDPNCSTQNLQHKANTRDYKSEIPEDSSALQNTPEDYLLNTDTKNEALVETKFNTNSQDSYSEEVSLADTKKSSLKNSFEISMKNPQEVTIQEDLNEFRRYSNKSCNNIDLKKNKNRCKTDYSRLASSQASSKGKSGRFGSTVINNLNKKISALRREIESSKKEINSVFDLIYSTEKEVEENKGSISGIKENIAAINDNYVKMEKSFVKALNRKSIDLKLEKKRIFPNVLTKDTYKTQRDSNDRLKRIVVLETSVDKVINDTNYLKTTQKDKLNEIVQTIHHLNQARNKVDKEFSQMQNYVIKLEESLKKDVEKIQKNVDNIQDPLTSVLSDQQRENQQLTEDMKRHQGLLRNIIEDYIGTLDYHRSIYSNIPQEMFSDSAHTVYSTVNNSKRTKTTSPAVSLKQRFASQHGSTRFKDDSIDEKMLTLPRILKRSAKNQPKLTVNNLKLIN